MDNIIYVFKCLFVYVIILVPQLRLANFKYDPHIGNFTASRVSGKSFKSIFFSHSFGVPIPILSLSVQYDFFGGKLSKYKILHAIFVAATGPLFYIFSDILIKNELAAFIAAILYAVSFCFPITGSWLIKSEHYETLFFLSGGSILILANNNQWFIVVGSLILGCCLLCKLPALISFWLVSVVLVKQYSVGGYVDMAAVLTAYLTPFFVYTVAGQIIFRPHHSKKDKSEGASQTNIISIIKSVPGTYLYFYKRDTDGYIKDHLKYHSVEYIKQFLPIIILAMFFLLHDVNPEKWVIVFGLVIVSLIFIIRMSFSHIYSFNIVLCIAAGLAIVRLLENNELILICIVLVATVYSFIAISRDPTSRLYLNTSVSTTAYDVLAEHIRTTLHPYQSIFVNINRSVAFVYPLAGHSLPCHTNLLTIGGYGPRIEHTRVPSIIAAAGIDLASNFSRHPPDYLVQSCIDWPIVNMAALEKYCGITYHVESFINPFVVYRLAERQKIDFNLDNIDMHFLFNADQGMTETQHVAQQFMQYSATGKDQIDTKFVTEYARHKREYLLGCKKQLMLDHAVGKATADIEYYAKLYFYFQDDSALISEMQQNKELYSALTELGGYFNSITPVEAVVEIDAANGHLAEIVTKLASMDVIRLRAVSSVIHENVFDTIPATLHQQLFLEIVLDRPLQKGIMAAIATAGFEKIDLFIPAASADAADVVAMLQAATMEAKNNGIIATAVLLTDCRHVDTKALADSIRPIGLSVDIAIACACPYFMASTGAVYREIDEALGRTNNSLQHYYCDPRHVLTVRTSGQVKICSNHNAPDFGSVLEQDALDVWGDHLFCRTRWEMMVGLPLPICTGCSLVGASDNGGIVEGV